MTHTEPADVTQALPADGDESIDRTPPTTSTVSTNRPDKPAEPDNSTSGLNDSGSEENLNEGDTQDVSVQSDVSQQAPDIAAANQSTVTEVPQTFESAGESSQAAGELQTIPETEHSLAEEPLTGSAPSESPDAGDPQSSSATTGAEVTHDVQDVEAFEPDAGVGDTEAEARSVINRVVERLDGANDLGFDVPGLYDIMVVVQTGDTSTTGTMMTLAAGWQRDNRGGWMLELHDLLATGFGIDDFVQAELANLRGGAIMHTPGSEQGEYWLRLPTEDGAPIWIAIDSASTLNLSDALALAPDAFAFMPPGWLRTLDWRIDHSVSDTVTGGTETDLEATLTSQQWHGWIQQEALAGNAEDASASFAALEGFVDELETTLRLTVGADGEVLFFESSTIGEIYGNFPFELTVRIGVAPTDHEVTVTAPENTEIAEWSELTDDQLYLVTLLSSAFSTGASFTGSN